MTRTDLSFTSQGVDCTAWHFPATSEALHTEAGRPCVVMAHGFGATKDCGLDRFATSFAAAGCDAFVFDYRGFGDSAGEPRQLIDLAGQLADYHAAVRTARALDGVDPDRIVVWGVSMSGGHAFQIASEDGRLAAAISVTPASDGAAAVREIIKRDGIRSSLRAMPAALRDAWGARRGKPPVYLPLAGRPGEVAALTAPGAYEAYTELGGPTWRNEFTARTFLQAGRYRPGRSASKIGCPVLVQVADLDQSAPPMAAVEAAKGLKVAEVRHYPCDHFDVYPGAEWHDSVVAHQVDFLTRRLTPVSQPA